MADHSIDPVAGSPEWELSAYRPLAFAIAYRMVGSVAETEDIIQEAFLRLHRARQEGVIVESPKAYLAALTTRLAIDHLRSARVRRESYVGPWLPEPVIQEGEPAMARQAEMTESVSMAFMLILEALSPVERAVFLLREVFDYSYDEIAGIVEKSEDNCRQIFARAKRHIDAGKRRFEPSPAKRDEIAELFFAACQRGELEGLIQLLAADAAFSGDGGGKAVAVTRPVVGGDRVARFLLGIFGKNEAANETYRRFRDHLKENGVNAKEANFVMGREIKFDSKAETITGDAEASKLLTRDYRKPYVVPENV